LRLHRLLRFTHKKQSVVVVKLNNQLARAQSHSIFSTTMNNQPNEYYSVVHLHTPPPSILTDLNDCDSSTFRLLCSALKPTPTLTRQMGQQPAMDEAAQVQAILHEIFEEEEKTDDIHSPPPTPRRYQYWEDRLSIYSRMKYHFQSVHCDSDSDFSSMFIRGRNTRSSISQETASLKQIFDEVYPQLSAKEQRIFPTFQQYKNWSRNTRWIFSASNPSRGKNLCNRKWLYHLLASYGFQ